MALNIKKLLVSQPKPASEKSPYFDIAEKYGVEIDFRPFIKVEPLSSKEFRQQKISILDHTAVVFTARTAIDHFFHLCEELRVAIPETMKYFCMTEAIAVYLQKYIVYRKRKIFFGQTGKLDDLVTVIGKHAKEKYLVPVSDVHKDDLLTMLEAKKISFTKAVMYRTVSNDFSKDEKFDYDMLVFFSPSGISSLLKNFPNFKQEDIKIGCFGPTTAKAVKEAGLRLDVEAPTPEAPSMTAALELYLKKEMGSNKKNGNRRYTLSKEERLSWKRYIDLLFAKGQSFVAFPLRVVYLAVEEETLAPVSILVSVPKKKFRRAVKRNLIKRQVREAYRVRKYDLIDPLTGKNKRMLVAFLYLDKEIHPFADMEKAMTKALNVLRDKA